MPERTFSCGYIAKFTEENYGKSFTCTQCGNIHSYPRDPNRKKKKPSEHINALALPQAENPFIKQFLYQLNSFWQQLQKLGGNIAAFFNFRKKNKVDIIYIPRDESKKSTSTSTKKIATSNIFLDEFEDRIIKTICKGDRDRFFRMYREIERKKPNFSRQEILEQIEFDYRH